MTSNEKAGTYIHRIEGQFKVDLGKRWLPPNSLLADPQAESVPPMAGVPEWHEPSVLRFLYLYRAQPEPVEFLSPNRLADTREPAN